MPSSVSNQTVLFFAGNVAARALFAASKILPVKPGDKQATLSLLPARGGVAREVAAKTIAHFGLYRPAASPINDSNPNETLFFNRPHARMLTALSFASARRVDDINGGGRDRRYASGRRGIFTSSSKSSHLLMIKISAKSISFIFINDIQ